MFLDIFAPLHRLNLNLFDGEGGGDGGAATGETQAAPVYTRRGKATGEYDGVVFGKQDAADSTPPAAGEEGKGSDRPATSDTLEAKRQSYRDLIDGEYKDFYTEDVQKIINRRFKETKGLQEQVNQYQPIIDLLTQKYQVDDATALMEAIEGDDVYWADAAEEAGMTVEQYKEFQRLRRENDALARQQQMQRGQQEADRQLSEWYQQADATKAVYPSFDLQSEAQNPEFVSLLKAGVPVQHAYEVVHMQEIRAAERQMTQQATERQLTANVRARGSRPAENGTVSQGAFTVKDDVSKLSKKDRAEIAKRVQRGEIIRW